MNPSAFHCSRQFAETPFGRIAYIERGAGPVALFLHALPLCGYQWREEIEDLAAVRRCIAPDLMGLGYSDVPAAQDLSFAEQARMVAAFLDALGIDRVDLCGNDTGGGISQIVAATYPSRVRTLTLTNCEVHDLWPNAMLTQFYETVAAGLAAEGMKAMLRDVDLARAQLSSVYEHAEGLTAEPVAVYFEPLVTSAKRVAQLGQFSDWRKNRAQMVAMAPHLRTSTIPAQLIWGEADTAFDMRPSLAWLQSNLGGLKSTTTVPRAKLFFPEEHARLVSVMLKEFWSSVS
ncbi:MAG TPA: alpha/beta fold hydrolase [Candidatus Acidoferrales bacterium]|nr:alpha/beta fold hydrolase [Candidatus Acidoferrales bacterium]